MKKSFIAVKVLIINTCKECSLRYLTLSSLSSTSLAPAMDDAEY
nr:MAG TPA: Papain inhibitor papain inhibitor, transglutaminase, glutamine [Caudoviricetes sp.]